MLSNAAGFVEEHAFRVLLDYRSQRMALPN